MIRVLLVDDHPVVRTGYKRLLLQEPGIEVVAEAANADDGYQAFQIHRPDVTVTDVSMPGSGGLTLLQKILQRQADAKVLVCSMYDSPPLVQRALVLVARGTARVVDPHDYQLYTWEDRTQLVPARGAVGDLRQRTAQGRHPVRGGGTLPER